LEKDILEKETDAHQQTRVPMNAWKRLVSVLTSPRKLSRISSPTPTLPRD